MIEYIRPLKTSFVKLSAAGLLSGITLLVLSACSSDKVDVPTPVYVLPSPPTPAAVVSAVKAAAAESKLTPPLEVSAVRSTDHGPGHFFVCLREANPTLEKRVVYSVFFDNDVYMGSRRSVIIEACETQTFAGIDTSPPASPPQRSGKRKR